MSNPPSPDLGAARAVKARLMAALGEEPAVRGVGLVRHNDGWAVKVNLAAAGRGPDVPSELDGVPVVVEVVGEIRPQSP